MPVRLKKARATFQRMVNKVFKELIRYTVKVYVDEVLVKSHRSTNHVQHLSEVFNRLQKYKARLYLEKCTFHMAFRKFLVYLVTQWGIKVNPD